MEYFKHRSNKRKLTGMLDVHHCVWESRMRFSYKEQFMRRKQATPKPLILRGEQDYAADANYLHLIAPYLKHERDNFETQLRELPSSVVDNFVFH